MPQVCSLFQLIVFQGPRSTVSDSILWGGGGTRHLFLLTLYNSKILGGGGGGHVACSAVPVFVVHYIAMLCLAIKSILADMLNVQSACVRTQLPAVTTTSKSKGFYKT